MRSAEKGWEARVPRQKPATCPPSRSWATVDRAGAYAVRHAALHAVQTGADTCRVTVAYAPNQDVPLDVVYEMDGRAERLPREWFAHSAARDRYRGGAFVAGLGARGHFGDAALPWNDPTTLRASTSLLYALTH